MKMPLEDVTVLDLSHALAGPHCSTMLADFGAHVIKLETPGSGDIARAWGSPLPGGENSYFVGLHRNKKGIAIDLKSAEGKELFFRLVEKADVVLENFRPGALEKLGLGYEQARARNRGIIYCSVSGFGQDGPYRERAALDLILQAESGMLSVTGEEGGSGVRCGASSIARRRSRHCRSSWSGSGWVIAILPARAAGAGAPDAGGPCSCRRRSPGAPCG
jgi:formyl-CoA transferase/CoA:oxalate CoA-transferase